MTGPTQRPYEVGDDPAPNGYTVRATFDRRADATKAVRGLTQRSVPADAIDVFVLGASGRPVRAIEVEDEAGALRGAMIGAAVGAVVGVVAIVLVRAGLLGPTVGDPLDLQSVAGALRGVVVSAVAGVPLGALLGTGHWQGRKKITPDGTRPGPIMVTVRTRGLEELSRGVLEDAGAVRVSAGPWPAPGPVT